MPLTDAQRLFRRTRKSTPPSAIPGTAGATVAASLSPRDVAAVASFSRTDQHLHAASDNKHQVG